MTSRGTGLMGGRTLGGAIRSSPIPIRFPRPVLQCWTAHPPLAVPHPRAGRALELGEVRRTLFQRGLNLPRGDFLTTTDDRVRGNQIGQAFPRTEDAVEHRPQSLEACQSLLVRPHPVGRLRRLERPDVGRGGDARDPAFPHRDHDTADPGRVPRGVDARLRRSPCPRDHRDPSAEPGRVTVLAPAELRELDGRHEAEAEADRVHLDGLLRFSGWVATVHRASTVTAACTASVPTTRATVFRRRYGIRASRSPRQYWTASPISSHCPHRCGRTRQPPRNEAASRTAMTCAPARASWPATTGSERSRPGDEDALAWQDSLGFDEHLHGAGREHAGQRPAGERDRTLVPPAASTTASGVTRLIESFSQTSRRAVLERGPDQRVRVQDDLGPAARKFLRRRFPLAASRAANQDLHRLARLPIDLAAWTCVLVIHVDSEPRPSGFDGRGYARRGRRRRSTMLARSLAPPLFREAPCVSTRIPGDHRRLACPDPRLPVNAHQALEAHPNPAVAGRGRCVRSVRRKVLGRPRSAPPRLSLRQRPRCGRRPPRSRSARLGRFLSMIRCPWPISLSRIVLVPPSLRTPVPSYPR